MQGSRRSVPIAALMLLLATSLVWAQATAQLNGRVTDESGAVLPGVTVTATQTDTGFVRTAVTDDSGSWVMPNLPIGPYKLEVALQGFKTYVQTGIVLQVGDNPTLPITLQLGQLEETVTVSGSAALVETRNPGIGRVVTNQQVLELPLNGRQLTELVFQAGLQAKRVVRAFQVTPMLRVALSPEGAVTQPLSPLPKAAHPRAPIKSRLSRVVMTHLPMCPCHPRIRQPSDQCGKQQSQQGPRRVSQQVKPICLSVGNEHLENLNQSPKGHQTQQEQQVAPQAPAPGQPAPILIGA